MKKALLLFSILLTIQSIAQTSIYHPFPENSAIWNFHYSMYCFQNGQNDDTYSITIDGDTIINNQTYHKLVTPFIQSNSTGSCGFATSIDYNGAIREDIANKKVYYIPSSENLEQLLYDFTLEVGDTVKGYLEPDFSELDTVHSIDSVLVGNNYHKRWLINSCYDIYIIEGIGSTFGLIHKSNSCMTDLDNYSLNCFQQNGNSLYPESANNCNLITEILDIDKNENITILKNQINNSVTIEIENISNIKEIQIIDIKGNIIYQKINPIEKRINFNNYSNGIYFLYLKDSKGNLIFRNKIIKE